jgi:hypothetical protein
LKKVLKKYSEDRNLWVSQILQIIVQFFFLKNLFKKNIVCKFKIKKKMLKNTTWNFPTLGLNSRFPLNISPDYVVNFHQMWWKCSEKTSLYLVSFSNFRYNFTRMWWNSPFCSEFYFHYRLGWNCSVFFY